ncbi:hypothetical protein VNI00_008812 [Paramarasmius palmivorus]|uniref:Uncharacterized protein n=1 Tax=Paramarasmius palmivorus TaxID=297713 RepID=A0AAW0CU70_9AGAR
MASKHRASQASNIPSSSLAPSAPPKKNQRSSTVLTNSQMPNTSTAIDKTQAKKSATDTGKKNTSKAAKGKTTKVTKEQRLANEMDEAAVTLRPRLRKKKPRVSNTKTMSDVIITLGKSFRRNIDLWVDVGVVFEAGMEGNRAWEQLLGAVDEDEEGDDGDAEMDLPAGDDDGWGLEEEDEQEAVQEQEKGAQSGQDVQETTDNEVDDEQAEMEIVRATWDRILELFPQIKDFLGCCADNDENGIETFHNMLKKAPAVMKFLTPPPAALKDILEVRNYMPSYTSDSKQRRGNSDMLIRLLFATKEDLVYILRNGPTGFDQYTEAMDDDFLTHDDLPGFLYDLDVMYACQDHDFAGLLFSDILIKVAQNIFTSPSSVGGEKQQATRPDNAKICGIDKVTPQMIAYTCHHTRLCLAQTTNFKSSDGAFNYRRFYYNILEIISVGPDKWRTDLLEFWNLSIFGHKAGRQVKRVFVETPHDDTPMGRLLKRRRAEKSDENDKATGSVTEKVAGDTAMKVTVSEAEESAEETEETAGMITDMAATISDDTGASTADSQGMDRPNGSKADGPWRRRYTSGS